MAGLVKFIASGAMVLTLMAKYGLSNDYKMWTLAITILLAGWIASGKE